MSVSYSLIRHPKDLWAVFPLQQKQQELSQLRQQSSLIPTLMNPGVLMNTFGILIIHNFS
jgi:hypothetical protein